ncbi:unnamed protein product [Heterobilharzia americana]|nr:unnamed protein product [Heterobilharzia americana]
MDEVGESVTISQPRSRLFHFRNPLHAKIAKTSALCYTWICLGLYSEVLGPTLPTLMHNTHSDYEHIGMALSTRAIGLLFGSLLGGILSDRFKNLRAVFIMLSLLIGAITTIIVPWCPDIVSLTAVLFIAGISHGFLTTNGNPLLASVWKEKAAGPFSLMHSGYGMGAAIAPLLVKPFTLPSVVSNNSLIMNTTKHDDSRELVIVDAAVPYSIISGIIFLCIVYFFVIVCFDHPRFGRQEQMKSSKSKDKKLSSNDKSLEEKSLESPSINCSKLGRKIKSFCIEKYHGVTKTKLLVVCCTFITFFTTVGNERVFGKFMFTYALYGPVKLSTSDGYLINLIYWICFCSARIITFLIALYISENIVLISLAFGTLFSSIGLIALPHTKFWFFLCTTLFSLFKSPLFPATLACINHSSEISGFLVIIVNFGSASGATLLQYTAGHLIHLHGQFVFPYLVTGTACLLVIAACVLILGLRHIGSRFKHSDDNPIATDNSNQEENSVTTLPRTTAVTTSLASEKKHTGMNDVNSENDGL